jgi:gluconolactonase
MSILTQGVPHAECVAWHPDGHLVAGTDVGDVLVVPVDGSAPRVAARAERGYLGGIAIDGRGLAYICHVDQRVVLRIDLTSGAIQTYSSGSPDRPFKLPNYPVFDLEGRLYVSDSGAFGEGDGTIQVIEPDGRTWLPTDEAFEFSNGLAIDPSGRYLYAVEGTAPAVSRLEIHDDGSLGPKAHVFELPRHVPDGLAFTADGRLLVSCYRPDTVLLWNGEEVTTLVDDWTGLTLCTPTNVAFGGTGLDRLFATSLGLWHTTEIHAGLVGAKLNYPLNEGDR